MEIFSGYLVKNSTSYKIIILNYIKLPKLSLIRLLLSVILTCSVGCHGPYAQEIIALPVNGLANERPIVVDYPAIHATKTPVNIGAQAAIMAAIGAVKQTQLGYLGAALVGITAIMNNNDNDGRPATYTGGDGSNFAAGG